VQGLKLTYAAPFRAGAQQRLSLRRLPHPYKAMVAICSDLDGTADGQAYRETMRFLNTAESTSMGRGVALEVGNSIYFDMPPGEFSYWNTDHAGRDMIRTLIRSGHIDCLHSYGELAATRARADKAIDELERHGCRLSVWVDHSRAPTNFGSDIMQGHGDRPGHRAYHADLTIAHGVRYVWRGRVTSIAGQDVPRHLGGILTASRPVSSARTLAKELAKGILARCGSRKYAIHLPNRVVSPAYLQDGQGVHEFLRSNPHWEGVSSCRMPHSISQVLSEHTQSRLIGREGICVLYTHLGKGGDPRCPFDQAARQALRRLAGRCQDGDILVCTTFRLLRYLVVRDHLSYTAARIGNRTIIRIGTVNDPVSDWRLPTLEELQGITFVTDGPGPVEVQDYYGKQLACRTYSVGGATQTCFPWRRLAFPAV
jgi:hypothetical protein